MKLQMLLMKLMRFLGAEVGDQASKEDPWIANVMEPIKEILNNFLLPFLILIGSAGTIYAIVLGVQYSKAETSEKRDEAKKRMINAIIGIVVMLVLIVLLRLFVDNAEAISTWIKTTVDEARGDAPNIGQS